MVEATSSANAKRKTQLVEESPKVQKTRLKLKLSLEKERAQITPEALEQTAEKIRQKFAVNVESGNYESVEGKPLPLFAQNQNAAEISKKVKAIALSIQNIPTAALDPFGKPFIKVSESAPSV